MHLWCTIPDPRCTSETQASYKTWHRSMSEDWSASLIPFWQPKRPNPYQIYQDIFSRPNALNLASVIMKWTYDLLFYHSKRKLLVLKTIQMFQHPTSSASFPYVPNTNSRWFIRAMIHNHRWHRVPKKTAWFLSSRPPKRANCPRKGITCSSTKGHSARFSIWPLDATCKSPFFPLQVGED